VLTGGWVGVMRSAGEAPLRSSVFEDALIASFAGIVIFEDLLVFPSWVNC